MPISALELSALLKFTLTKTVTGWEDIEQGENEFSLLLTDIDTDVWNQVYAAKHTLAAAGTATIDLRSFTNLAGEAVVMTAALGIAVKFEHSDPTDVAGELTIGAGASNGLAAWFLPDMVIDAPTAGSTRTLVMCGDTADEGVTVDATHKTIDLENTGTDAIVATVIVIGSTV